jgi:CheY-like chemotaxis protein
LTPPHRVLLIDDDVGLTRLLRLGLEETGRFEVQAANSGGEGLAVLRSFEPDVVILDMIMPDMRGTHVLAEIRSDPALETTPVIFLTALVPAKLDPPLVLGCPCLVKPVTAMEVAEVIEQVLPAGPVEKERPTEVGPDV